MKRFNFDFLFSGTNAALFGGFVAFLLLFFAIQPIQKRAVSTTLELLHVSFDPTREVIHEINEAFALDWQKFKGGKVQIFQSHGGSGSQARSARTRTSMTASWTRWISSARRASRSSRRTLR